MLLKLGRIDPRRLLRCKRRIPQIREIYNAIVRQLSSITVNEQLELVNGVIDAYQFIICKDTLGDIQSSTGGKKNLTELAQKVGRFAVAARDKGDIQRSNGIALYAIWLEAQAYSDFEQTRSLLHQITATLRNLLATFPESERMIEEIVEKHHSADLNINLGLSLHI